MKHAASLAAGKAKEASFNTLKGFFGGGFESAGADIEGNDEAAGLPSYVASLTNPYEHKFIYWEIFECFRKLTFT